MKTIFLVEDFYSIQGEGKFLGTPSIFIRLGGCNLNCKGFNVNYRVNGIDKVGCDSFYAVDSEFSNNWKKLEALSDFIQVLSKYPQRVKDIVITGGEPLIYANNQLFLEILRYLKKSGFRITIETNGTIELEKREEFQDIIFAIGLKLSNIEKDISKRFNLSAINSIIANSQKSFFKLTLDRESLKKGLNFEIVKTMRFFQNISVYCMPIGSDRKELEKNSEAVIKFCLDHNYIYSDRIHIRVWNNKRGV